MSIKSGLFGAITVILLIAVLGSGPVGDNLPSSGVAVATGSIHAVFRWDLSGFPGSQKTAQYVALVVMVLATFVLGALAGRARPIAAFIGGWGAAIGAAALAGIVGSLIAGDDGAFGGASDVADRAYVTANSFAGAMVWLGWLVGIAVMIGSFGKNQPKVGAAAPAAGYAAPQGPPPGAPPPGAAPQFPPPGAAAPSPAPPSPPPGAPSPAPAPISAPPPGAPDLAKPAPPPGAPGVASPPPAAPPPGAGAPPSGPQIGPPPDRTQVYGQPPPQQ